MPRSSSVPVVGVREMAAKSSLPWCGKPSSLATPSSSTWSAGTPVWPGLGALGTDAQQIALVDREVGVDRVDLVDLGELGLAVGADEVAGVDQMPAHAPVERGADRRVAEIDLGEIDLRLGAEHARLRLVAVGAPAVDVDRGGRLLLEQAGVAVELGLGVQELGLDRLELRLRLLQLRLVGVLLEREQQVALLDPLAVLEMDLVEDSPGPAPPAAPWRWPGWCR